MKRFERSMVTITITIILWNSYHHIRWEPIPSYTPNVTKFARLHTGSFEEFNFEMSSRWRSNPKFIRIRKTIPVSISNDSFFLLLSTAYTKILFTRANATKNRFCIRFSLLPIPLLLCLSLLLSPTHLSYAFFTSGTNFCVYDSKSIIIIILLLFFFPFSWVLCFIKLHFRVGFVLVFDAEIELMRSVSERKLRSCTHATANDTRKKKCENRIKHGHEFSV